MVVDVDIFQPDNPITNFFHFMATNIPGNDVSRGDVNFDYIPPFAFSYAPGQGLLQDGNFGHYMVALVFEQQGRVSYKQQQTWCSPEVFERLKVRGSKGWFFLEKSAEPGFSLAIFSPAIN